MKSFDLGNLLLDHYSLQSLQRGTLARLKGPNFRDMLTLVVNLLTGTCNSSRNTMLKESIIINSTRGNHWVPSRRLM